MTLLLLFALIVPQADSLTLDWFIAAAEDHFPRSREMAYADAVADLRLANLNARFRPSLAVAGQAVYHSEVASIPIAVPGASPPSVPHDQYKVGLSVNQLIWDAGATSIMRRVERVSRDARKQEVAVAAYGLRDAVQSAYFGILLADAQREQLATLTADLDARLEQIRAGIRRGVRTAADADALMAERIRVGQQQTSAEGARQAAIDVLGELSGRTLTGAERLAAPEPGPIAVLGRDRPEFGLLDLSREGLDHQSALAGRSRRPTVASFGEFAYGRPPGLNLFEDAITPFLSVGVRVTWNAWDWDVSRRRQAALSLDAEALDRQEEAFAQQLRVAIARVIRDIERLEALIESDDAIISLRARITADAAARLEGGAITTTDYLVERNAEHQARLSARIHRIQLAQAHARYKTIAGL